MNTELYEEYQQDKSALWEALEAQHELPDDEELNHLSGLLAEEIERFRKAWEALDVEARRRLIRKLQEIAEADFAMDFSAVFRIGMRDEDDVVRSAAIAGLDEVDDLRLISELTRILRNDPSAKARTAAAKGLGRFILLGELEKIREAPFKQALSALVEAYRDDEEELQVQRNAVESMAYTGLRDIPEIIEEAYRHQNRDMQISAVIAMGRSADRRWAKTVTAELESTSPVMRFEAVRACGELQLQEAAQEIIDLTEDVNIEIRLAALWALGQIGGRRARKTLESHVDSDIEAMSETAQAALGELEFLYGDLNTFFGAPSEFSGESDVRWENPGDPEDLYG